MKNVKIKDGHLLVAYTKETYNLLEINRRIKKNGTQIDFSSLMYSFLIPSIR